MDRIDELSDLAIGEAIRIRRELGPGLFENVYETVLAGRLEKRGLVVARQVPVPATIEAARGAASELFERNHEGGHSAAGKRLSP